MKKIILVFALLTAQLGWADEAMDKPYLSTSETIRVTAIVAAVNQETREVTLQLQDGQKLSFVASEDAGFMTGEALVIDGGWSAFGFYQSK